MVHDSPLFYTSHERHSEEPVPRRERVANEGMPTVCLASDCEEFPVEQQAQERYLVNPQTRVPNLLQRGAAPGVEVAGALSRARARGENDQPR